MECIVKQVKEDLLQADRISVRLQTTNREIQAYLYLLSLKFFGLQSHTFLREGAKINGLESLGRPMCQLIQALQRTPAAFGLLMNKFDHSLGAGVQVAKEQQLRIS